jgi:hypothetical protein
MSFQVFVTVHVYENEGHMVGQAFGKLWFSAAPRIGEKIYIRREGLYTDGVFDAGLSEKVIVKDVVHIPGVNGDSSLTIELEDVFADGPDRAKYILDYLCHNFDLELEFFM